MKYLDGALSLQGRQWIMSPYDEREALTLSQKMNLPFILGRLLAGRGIGLETCNDFLNPSLKRSLPDPSCFKDLDRGVDRLYQALKKGEEIVIFGDYDVDGATSSALLYRYLKSVGGKVSFYIPDRLQEGYGPNIGAIEKLAAAGAQVLVTVDCGMTAFEPLKVAQDLKVDVIVVDHHMPESRLPPAVAVINPNRLDESREWGHLAAVGVCFMILVGLNRLLRQQGYFKQFAEPNLISFLDLVALGTVCDVVPLKGLNRVFVAQGLKILGKRQNEGLKILMDGAGVSEYPTGYHLGFILGPRINAGGRVGHSNLGTRLLTTSHLAEAQNITQQLNEFNQERQEIEQLVLQEALAQAETQTTPFIVVAGQNWHPGVIGIVAGRLKERFYRPALVIALDDQGEGKGSGRSVPGVDLGAFIHKAKQQGLLRGGGGHGMAAGFTLEEKNLLPFHHFLNIQLKEFPVDLTPTLRVDSHLTLKGASTEFIKNLEKLAPYGQGNPAPRFLIENVRVVKANLVGKDHVRCILTTEEGDRLSAMAFRCGDQPLGEALLKSQGENFHMVATLKLDTWMGAEKVQLTLEDLMYARSLKRQSGPDGTAA